jgi:sugar lactone lactonase YvrE
MPAIRRSLLFVCLLLVPLFSLVLIRATSYAQPVLNATSPTIVPVADIPQARGVTIDAAGNLYSLGVDSGTVYKITPAGQVSVIADLPDISIGYVGPIFDPASGNLFVGRYASGNGNEVLKITPAGQVSTFAFIQSPSGLAADGQGNLFVTSYVCPGGALYKITAAGVVSQFGTGLCHPDGVAIGPNGDLFVGDRGTRQIMRIPAAGGAATVFATGFTMPIAVTFNQAGTLLVADYSTGTISSVNPNGVVSPFASGLNQPNGLIFDQQKQLYISNHGTNQIVRLDNSSQPTPIHIANVSQVRGVTIDPSDNLFALSRSTGIVYKITSAGQMSTFVDLPDGDEGYIGPIFDPATGNLFVSRYMRRTGTEILKITPAGVVSIFASPVANPSGLALDGQGNLYVSSDTNPGTVSKITSNGSISLFATGLNHPDGLAFGPNGDLFIGDRGTNRVMRVPTSGGQATVFATGLANPMDVEFDQTGRLFVANYDTGTIAVVDSSGVVSTFASGLTNPAGLAFDSQNQLYVADFGANQIVKLDNPAPPTPTTTSTSTPTSTPTVMPELTMTPTSTPPPIADHLTINGGALTTTSTNVRLDVSAWNASGGQDGLSMSFSNDGTTWSDWKSYAPSALWQLTGGDGEKTVYGRFKNSAGAISSIVSDTIALDTGVQAEYGVTINNGALYTCKIAVQLTISARPYTAEMQVSNDGGFNGATWEPYSAHKAWEITRYRNQEITRLVYVRFRDADGNVSSLYLDDIILDTNAPHGHVSIAGQGALLDLTATDDLSGVDSMRVSAQPDLGDASWEPFSTQRAWDFSESPIVYVQFRDAAGNLSPTYATPSSTVFLPVVIR